jgi:hypothetical protein
VGAGLRQRMIFGDRSTGKAVDTSSVLHKITTIYETLQIGARYANCSEVTRTHQSRMANEIKQPADMPGIECGLCVSFHLQKLGSKKETYHFFGDFTSIFQRCHAGRIVDYSRVQVWDIWNPPEINGSLACSIILQSLVLGLAP